MVLVETQRDDYGDERAQAAELTVDGPATAGRFETLSAADLFWFDAEEGQYYQVAVDGQSAVEVSIEAEPEVLGTVLSPSMRVGPLQAERYYLRLKHRRGACTGPDLKDNTRRLERSLV
ncbi:MAG: hypothetical protein ACI9MR_002114 [Myxococcota bacterium]|jgi:hypothetical protein